MSSPVIYGDILGNPNVQFVLVVFSIVALILIPVILIKWSKGK